MSYNFTKGGGEYGSNAPYIKTVRKTHKWPKLLFYNILDFASISPPVSLREFNPHEDVRRR